jgi:ribosomal protein L29
MALIKYKDIVKMEKKEFDVRFTELKMELIKANVTANKQNAKTKEIKRSIAKLMTFSNHARRAKNK